MSIRRALFFFPILAFAATAAAQPLAYIADEVITVSGDRYAPGMLLVEGELIVEAGPAANVPGGVATKRFPEGSRIYPGMILASSSLGLTEISAVPASNDHNEMGDFNAHVQAYRSINPDSELVPVVQAAGITHALVQPGGSFVQGQSAVMALQGWTWEERIVKAPAALHIAWPSQALDLDPDDPSALKTSKERRTKRIEELGERVAQARAYAAAQAAEGERHEVDAGLAAWGAALAGDIPVVVQADGRREIESALDWIEREGLRMILAGGRDAHLVAERLAKLEVPVVLQRVMAGGGHTHEGHDIGYRRAQLLEEAGVRFAFALGNGPWWDSLQRNLPVHAARAVAYGLSEEAALRALTLSPARILEIDERYGSLDAGKSASFIVVDGDLLDMRGEILHVFVDGREVSLENRHGRLYERYRKRPRPTEGD